MRPPTIEILPAKPVVCTDQTISLDVLIRITPGAPDVHFLRPALNIAIVLDRSGSMNRAKLKHAKNAAAFVVEHLLPTDRVSVTAFDSWVNTIVPNTLVTQRDSIINQIQSIHAEGSTDLHGGWLEGAKQALSQAIDGGVNRVMLLSDGQANVGVVDPNTIATEVQGMAARGVSTTTLGVGLDYNEDLMESIARHGDGRYYFIDSPRQLMDIFQTELHGLTATRGQRVSLGLSPHEGACVSDVLNDFQTVETGRLKLPNLVADCPINVVIRLMVPPPTRSSTLLDVRLAWNDHSTYERQILHASLNALPAVPFQEWTQVPLDPVVHEQEALLMAARSHREISHALQRGDYDTARDHIATTANFYAAPPQSSFLDEKIEELKELTRRLEDGEIDYSIKQAKWTSYRDSSCYGLPSKPRQNVDDDDDTYWDF